MSKFSDKSNTGKVLTYLLENGSITRNIAQNELGVNSLKVRVKDLQNAGYPVHRVDPRTKYAKGQCATYRLGGAL